MADNVSGRGQLKEDIGQPTSLEEGMNFSDASISESSLEVRIESKKSGVLSTYESSQEYFEHGCDLCKSDGDYTAAEDFCTKCLKYLCNTCVKSHSMSESSKDHSLFGRDNMQKKSPKLCNQCKTGVEIREVRYCKKCCDFLCDDCYNNYNKTKSTSNHMLVKECEDFDEVDSDVTSSVAKMNVKVGATCGEMANEEYTYVRNINVTLDADEKDCFITGMILVSNKKLVISDFNNKCIKLVDIDTDKIKEMLVLQTFPVRITAISTDKIAVVLENKYTIQIVKVGRKLTLGLAIKTSGNCLSIKMIKEHIYVSFSSPVKFQIIKPTGAIIKTIKPNDEVLKHCTLPRYIDVNPDESVIYVSDWKNNKVLSLDMNGNMIALYQEELDRPCGIIISPSGSVYVCDQNQHIVYKMPSDLSEALSILGQGDGLVGPYTIFLDTDDRHLFISNSGKNVKDNNFLRVFRY